MQPQKTRHIRIEPMSGQHPAQQGERHAKKNVPNPILLGKLFMAIPPLLSHPTSNHELQLLIGNRVIVPEHRRLHRIVMTVEPVCLIRREPPPVEERGVARQRGGRPARGRPLLDACLIERDHPRMLVADPPDLVEHKGRLCRIRDDIGRRQEVDAPPALNVFLESRRSVTRGWRPECAPFFKGRPRIQGVRRVGRDKVHHARWGHCSAREARQL